VGGYRDSVFFKLWNSILKKININIWAPDLLPNYRKRQLNLGFNYIPEHLVFKNYKNLNSNTYMKKRLDKYYYKNRDILEKFDLSYPITGQLRENRLNLIDKHIWGYSLNKVKKLDENEFYNLNNNLNNSFRFDNEIYINSKNSFSGIVPFYFTNRTHNLMTNINKYSGSSKYTISDIIHSNSPGVYKILGYHNIRNMGINKNFDSRFKINKNIPNFDILKSSFFYLKKKKSYNSLLSNFNNQVKTSFVNNSTLYLFLTKLNNITKIKNKNNIFSIVLKERESLNVFQKNKNISNYYNSKNKLHFRIRNYYEFIEYLKNKRYNGLMDLFFENKSKIKKSLYSTANSLVTKEIKKNISNDLIYDIDSLEELSGFSFELNNMSMDNKN
jgi:hypothetical protein